MTPRSIILCGTLEKQEYLGEKETKNKTILTHWLVAQAGSNDEKKWGQKSRWTAPLSHTILLQKGGWSEFKIIFEVVKKGTKPVFFICKNIIFKDNPV